MPILRGGGRAAAGSLSFSFSDGVNTITGANATNASFQVTTDGVGNIVHWMMSASISAPQVGGGTLKRISTNNNPQLSVGVLDAGEDTRCGPASNPQVCTTTGNPYYVQSGFNTDTPGTWQLRTAPSVPEPATTMLIGVALVGLGARRRARRAR